MGPATGRLWGRQQPFERNHFQRTLTVFALGAVLAVAVVLLVDIKPKVVVGTASVCAGLLCLLAAGSRHRYVREATAGFGVLRTRDGRFVFGSAVQLLVTAVVVTALIVS